MEEKIKCFLKDKKIPYEENISLKKKTWIHRGGNCSIYIIPSSIQQLKDIAFYLYKEKIKFLLVGHTSNLYILNSCDISVVISTIHCNKYEIKNNTILCECGVKVSRLAKNMSQQGISGFEYLHELPGTIAGAIYNNSSCKTNSISSLLVEADVITKDGNIVKMKFNDFEFNFRTSIFKEKRIDGIILKAILKIEKGNADEFIKIAEETKKDRKKSLEGNANNLGCTVNRPFVNGRMPLKYRFALKLYSIYLKLFIKDNSSKVRKTKNFLCYIAGYKNLAKYISDKNKIVYMWLDDDADAQFSNYLEFMRKVYKTDKVEIEIIS